ncbi:MAG: hypothetical protein AAFX55_19400 [Bacteroidota bacterium]
MGLYAPIIKGEIEGLKIGINTDLILREHTRNLQYEKLEGEWLIGFGVGFNKGQIIRSKLKEKAGETTLNERVKAVLYLLEDVSYDKFEIDFRTYLKNVENWESKHLSKNIIIEVKSLIKIDKLQRALMKIKEFYQKEKALTAMMQYSHFPNRLSRLRQDKQRDNITGRTYLLEKQKIKLDLERWIEINKN